MRKLLILGMACSAALSLTQSTAHAATYTSTQTGNWTAPATWGGSGPPIAGDTANILGGFDVTSNTANAAALVSIGGATSGKLILDSGANSLALTTGLTVGATGAGTGTFQLDSGTLKLTGGPNALKLQNGATTVWNQNGGVFDWSTAASGLIGGESEIGWGSGNATMNITGGTFQLNVKYFKFNGNSGSSATWNIGGGGSPALYRQMGDSGQAFLWGGGPTIVNLKTNGVMAIFRINQNGGWVGTAASNFTFDGGTLRALSGADILPAGFTAGKLQIKGGAILDSNSFNPTISAVIQHDTSVTTDGGLTKEGVGTWTLSGANTFNGDTKVNVGTLALGNVNALQNSKLDVSGAGSVAFTAAGTNTYNLGGLKGTGTINAGANTLKTASISAGNSVGLLTIGSALDISGVVDNGALVFELGSSLTPGTTYDQVSMAGSALNIGTLNFADFTFTTLAGYGSGVYKLFDAASITGSIGTATGLIGTSNATLSLVGNDVMLSIAAETAPEPGTATLLCLSGLAFAFFAKKRKSR